MEFWHCQKMEPSFIAIELYENLIKSSAIQIMMGYQIVKDAFKFNSTISIDSDT